MILVTSKKNVIITQKDIYEFLGLYYSFYFNLLMYLSALVLKDFIFLSLFSCLAKLIWSEPFKDLTSYMQVRNSEMFVDGSL